MRNLSLGRRHLVNAYEVEAGIGVIAGNIVWSMPEHLECEVLQKVRYINTLTFTILPLTLKYAHQNWMSQNGHIPNWTMYRKWSVPKWISLCTELDLVPRWIFCTENDMYHHHHRDHLQSFIGCEPVDWSCCSQCFVTNHERQCWNPCGNSACQNGSWRRWLSSQLPNAPVDRSRTETKNLCSRRYLTLFLWSFKLWQHHRKKLRFSTTYCTLCASSVL